MQFAVKAGVPLLAATLLIACAAGQGTPGPTAPPVTPSSRTSASPQPSSGPTSGVPGSSVGELETPPGPPPSVDSLPPIDDPDATPPPLPDIHSDPALDEMIGITVAGVELVTSSLSGEAAAKGGGYLPGLLAVLERDVADLSAAYGEDPTHQLQLVAFALRVRGVSEGDLLTAFPLVANIQNAETVDVAGKSVLRVPGAWTTYVRATGDVLLMVQTPDTSLAEEALGLLP